MKKIIIAIVSLGYVVFTIWALSHAPLLSKFDAFMKAWKSVNNEYVDTTK